MELELSDDQTALQESVRAVLERECPMSLVRGVVEEHKHAEELWSRMVELDWPALAVPEEAVNARGDSIEPLGEGNADGAGKALA